MRGQRLAFVSSPSPSKQASLCYVVLFVNKYVILAVSDMTYEVYMRSVSGYSSSAVSLTSPLTSSSHVTSHDVRGVTSGDFVTSLFIGALLFIPVCVILCVTVLIRLRNSGQSQSSMNIQPTEYL